MVLVEEQGIIDDIIYPIMNIIIQVSVIEVSIINSCPKWVPVYYVFGSVIKNYRWGLLQEMKGGEIQNINFAVNYCSNSNRKFLQ